MSDDPWDDPSAKVWVNSVLTDMAPKMANSALVMSLVPSNAEGDVKFWVELGACICMDKPILAIVMGDDVIPPKLELVADEIVRLAEGVTPEASEELAAAIVRLQDKAA